jgi:CheY-like chemotaxis protein
VPGRVLTVKILLVEDDRDVAEYVRRDLEDEGHAVSVCHDGASGLRAAELTAFDIIVLDVMLPFLDGLEVTRRLRRGHVQTPILLLTARDAPEEIVRGLDAGADDYLTKPFSFDVLLARIRARTRKAGEGEWLRFADLAPDLGTREARRGLTRGPAPRLRALLAGGQGALEGSGRHGARSDHREADRGAARSPPGRPERGGPRLHVLRAVSEPRPPGRLDMIPNRRDGTGHPGRRRQPWPGVCGGSSRSPRSAR